MNSFNNLSMAFSIFHMFALVSPFRFVRLTFVEKVREKVHFWSTLKIGERCGIDVENVFV